MDREGYYKKMGWKKSPFIKSTSFDIPIISRVDEYEEVCECIGGWDRIIIITAPIGYGKTTFMNQLVINTPRSVKYVISFNAYEPVDNVMSRIRDEIPFFKRLLTRTDRTIFGENLKNWLGNDKMLLIFDEAQDYDIDLFKWLRILNDRTDNVFMIFLGLQGLEDKITSEASFRDRKSKSVKLKPFYIEDLEEIIKERIKWAGGKDFKPFTPDGLRRCCESCNHVPRLLLENAQKVIEECAIRESYTADANLVEEVLGKISHETAKPTYPPQKAEKVIIAGKVLDEPRDESSENIGGHKGAIIMDTENKPETGVDDHYFMDDLSPTQQEIVKLLLDNESLSISELSEKMRKEIRSIGSLIRKLRGLNQMEVARKPNVPYPVIVRKGKETRVGRLQYVYSLSDNARRLLANK